MNRLLILSGKGGTGKTTVSASFIKLSNAKGVADCDVDAPNLHLVINNDSEPQVSNFYGSDKAVVDNNLCTGCGTCVKHCRFNGVNLVNGKAVVNQYSCEGCGVCNYVCTTKAISLQADIAGECKLYLDKTVFSTATLKMGRGNSGKLVSKVKLAMFKNISQNELTIVDGSPGLGCPVIASVSGMDLILIVAEPSQSGISDLKRLVKTVRSFDSKIAVCVNKFDTNTLCTDTIKDYCKNNNIPFVGAIPYDKQAVKLNNNNQTIVDISCPAGNAVREIYNSVLKLL